MSRGVGSSVPSPRRGEGRGEGEIPPDSGVESEGRKNLVKSVTYQSLFILDQAFSA